jgi:putative ABC transport system permease protein
MSSAIAASLAAAVLGLVLLGFTAALTSRSLLRVVSPAGRRALRFVPFELLLLGTAWFSARGLAPEAIVPIEGRRVVDTSAAVLLLPLAVLGLGGALAARLWWWLTRRSRSRHLPAHLSLRLALRRLQFGSKAGTAILGAGTLALGVSVFGLTMNSSLERTGAAKSAVFVGSDVRVLIAGRLPPDTEGATEVWVREEMEYDGLPVDVIAIDPASFADAAFWDPSFADSTLTELVERLKDGSSGFGVIGVGQLADVGQLSNPNTQRPPVQVEVSQRANVFPGAGLLRPTLIMTLEQAQRSPITFRHFVWARGTFEHWRTALQDLGAQPMLGISRSDAVDSSVLAYAGWAFDFVRALGIFVGILVAAALLLHLAVRQRQQALGFAFLRRMGFGHRRHWWALLFEVGGLLLTVFALGGALALLCVHIVSPNVDPLPRLPPGPLIAVPWWSLAMAGSIGIALVVVGSSVAQALGARVDVAEVLRDGT